MLCGCATYDDPYFVHSVWRQTDAEATRADVYFVTDRKKNPYIPDGFGYARDGMPSCGLVHVTIPPARMPTGPALFARETGRETLACGEEKGDIANTIAASARAGNCRGVLIFVHGFDTGFETAVLRAAQLGSDTQWRCPVLAFSWSSTGQRTQYDLDRHNTEAAEPLFAELLQALAARGLKPNIVAHSLGARLALRTLAQNEKTAANEVVLAAPDIGADGFAALYKSAAPRLHRLTLYASSEDSALALSRRINGAARVGREPDAVYGGANIDVIDASAAFGGMTGHEYYGLSTDTLADMSLVLADIPEEKRLLPRAGAAPTCCRRTSPFPPRRTRRARRPSGAGPPRRSRRTVRPRRRRRRGRASPSPRSRPWRSRGRRAA